MKIKIENEKESKCHSPSNTKFRSKLRISTHVINAIANAHILCVDCARWFEKRYTGITGRLKSNVDFHWRRCLESENGFFKSVLVKEFMIKANEKVQFIPKLCYSGKYNILVYMAGILSNSACNITMPACIVTIPVCIFTMPVCIPSMQQPCSSCSGFSSHLSGFSILIPSSLELQLEALAPATDSDMKNFYSKTHKLFQPFLEIFVQYQLVVGRCLCAVQCIIELLVTATTCVRNFTTCVLRRIILRHARKSEIH